MRIRVPVVCDVRVGQAATVWWCLAALEHLPCWPSGWGHAAVKQDSSVYCTGLLLHVADSGGPRRTSVGTYGYGNAQLCWGWQPAVTLFGLITHVAGQDTSLHSAEPKDSLPALGMLPGLAKCSVTVNK